MQYKDLKRPLEDVCFYELPVVSLSMLYRCSLDKRSMMKLLSAVIRRVKAEQRKHT